MNGPSSEPASPTGTAADGVPVCGTVRHADGSAVAGAALTLVDAAGRQVGRGATGTDGRYALATAGRGGHVLIAAADGHRPHAVTLAAADRPVDLDVVLGAAGRLAGRVTTADGAPVPDAVLTLTDAHGDVAATTRSGPDGAYALAELAAGDHTLTAAAPTLRPAAVPVAILASHETRQDIALAGGTALHGVVRAPTGRVVEDARVTLLDLDGNVLRSLTTAPDGVFHFAGLAPGSYTVVAAGHPPATTVVRLATGAHTQRDLRLGHQR